MKIPVFLLVTRITHFMNGLHEMSMILFTDYVTVHSQNN